MKFSILIIVLSISTSVFAQEAERVFAQDDVLEVTFSLDLETVLNDVSEEREQHPAFIAYQKDGESISVPLKVKTRGNFRRNPENCSFPPLRLNFAKKTSEGTLFDGLDKVKLVTHCQTNKEVYEQYVVQEYLLYRTYNQLTDKSFRARLLKITYEDEAGNREPLTRLGFIIEDEELMASRNGGELFDKEDLKSDKVDHDQTTLLYLFEYMIGNIDWNVNIHHNMKLIGKHANATMTPVPYDFDHASVVNTEYADEAPNIGTASLRYQLFRDFCRSEKELLPYFKLFNEQKESIYQLYNQNTSLTENQRRRTLRHYDRFYRVINDEVQIEKTFVRTCQG